MSELRNYNIKVLNKFKLIKNNNISAPLLVSNNIPYIKNNNNILYIGQETNSWINFYNENYTLKDLNYNYKNFLLNENTNNKLFWKFIKSINENNLNNIIWANTLIAGKKDGKGTPKYNNELIKLSINYLTFLYMYFKPKYVIIVSGPTNPYYKIITSFLENINISVNAYPTFEEKLVNSNNIYWTYHPSYLNRTNEFNNVKNKIKSLIK